MTLLYHQNKVMQKLTVRFSDKEYQDLARLSQKTERSRLGFGSRICKTIHGKRNA